MKLTEYFSLSRFLCPLKAQSIGEAYRELIYTFNNKKLTEASDEIVERLLETDEDIFNIEPGISIPHIRVDFIKNIELSVGLTKKGINNQTGKDKTFLFFLEFAPEDESEKHIYFLAELAKLIEHLKAKELAHQVMTSSQLYSKLTGLYDSIGDE